MHLDKAKQYRREAEKCLEQAELAPDEPMKAHKIFLASQWLKMAAAVAAVPAV